jgi:hypothetical protein
MRRFLKWCTRWLWADELTRMMAEANGAYRELSILQLNTTVLIDLFREKQHKINRLQSNYVTRTAPLREDLRSERPMGNLQDHLNLLAMAPEREERMRKGKFPGKPSDGTVEGVPFDKPNEAVAEPFDSPRVDLTPRPAIMGRRGYFTAAGADPNAT